MRTTIAAAVAAAALAAAIPTAAAAGSSATSPAGGAGAAAGSPVVAPAPAASAKRAVGYPPYPPSLTVKTELRLKVDLVKRNLRKSPQLVFFGGSRSQRFDPASAQRRTGLRAVNIAHSCARPEAAWACLNWFYRRWPGANIRWVWGMQSGMLRDRDLDEVLLQDERFYPCFPDDLLKAQRAKLPRTRADMPHSYGFLRNRYSARGLLLWNRYDQRRAAGYPLKRALDVYIARMLRTNRTSTEPDTRARRYFEDTIRLLNEHGTTPVIVLMPIHPRVLRVMEKHDMGGERQRLRAYLADLGETLSIKVLDFTTIGSFNGKAAWFYDGVHVTRGNADRIIVAVRGQAGEYLK